MSVDPQQMEQQIEQVPETTTEVTPESSDVNIDGQSYSVDEIKTWREAADNRQKWERSLKQKDMQYASTRQHLEAAFGKRFGEFDGNDFADLQAFGLFNNRLRSDPSFRQHWHDALVEAGRRAGLSKEEAKTQATETVKEQVATGTPTATSPAAPAQATVPPEVLAQLRELREGYQALQQMSQQVRQAQVQQTLGALEEHIDGRIEDSFGRFAVDMPDAHDEVRERVLYSLLQYDDAELLEMARSGELSTVIDEAAKGAVGRIKGYVEKSLKARVPAVRQIQKALPTAPFKGAPAAAAKQEIEGLRAMSQRLMKEYPQTG